ncbi:hypothetical protein [Lichenibacterium dinghuense]|uniref:hypothetical protein n=1 Tax=Lichenibacterium dinghuense TaxID=2895977 RepID=UPI001F2FC9B5|nr:hypothetical protein [Lichenibacterium sp. 6Y81]
MSTVLRDLSNSTRRMAEVRFIWPGSVLFDVDGERLTCTCCGPETKSATVDRILALQIFMGEYKKVFERVQVISHPGNRDYVVALDCMKYSQYNVIECRGSPSLAVTLSFAFRPLWRLDALRSALTFDLEQGGPPPIGPHAEPSSKPRGRCIQHGVPHPPAAALGRGRPAAGLSPALHALAL